MNRHKSRGGQSCPPRKTLKGRVEVWRGDLRARGVAVAGGFRLLAGASFRAMLRFHTPLIEPDGRISRIRLSDKDHDFAHE